MTVKQIIALSGMARFLIDHPMHTFRRWEVANDPKPSKIKAARKQNRKRK